MTASISLAKTFFFNWPKLSVWEEIVLFTDLWTQDKHHSSLPPFLKLHDMHTFYLRVCICPKSKKYTAAYVRMHSSDDPNLENELQLKRSFLNTKFFFFSTYSQRTFACKWNDRIYANRYFYILKKIKEKWT